MWTTTNARKSCVVVIEPLVWRKRVVETTVSAVQNQTIIKNLKKQTKRNADRRLFFLFFSFRLVRAEIPHDKCGCYARPQHCRRFPRHFNRVIYHCARRVVSLRFRRPPILLLYATDNTRGLSRARARSLARQPRGAFL